MAKPYLFRLVAITSLFDKPSKTPSFEAYHMLFELWSKYSSNTQLCSEIKLIAKCHPRLEQEFRKQIRELESINMKKATILKKNLNHVFPKSKFPTLFISYAHEDEEFKDELDKMLAGLKRQGILDTWHDRCIEPGAEWFRSIKTALEECDLAILLVSPDFIASGFIQREELTRLFTRRVKDNLRVMPIIVRPCLWQSEPIIKDLQALPNDGQPVISFPKKTGARDEVWMIIGKAIEKIAKEL
jgi:hypothetical protein